MKKIGIVLILIVFVGMLVTIICYGQIIQEKEQKIVELEDKLYLQDVANQNLKKEKNILIEENKTLQNKLDILRKEIGKITSTKIDSEKITITDSEREILAKLLYAEAGVCNWQGQVYTCSAILNLSEHSQRSIWEMAHDFNTFSVAHHVDSVTPNSTQYAVIDYVLNGGLVPEICYFRTDYYHSFGTPVCKVDGHYFSKP